jgi:V8-like Glu-specific endopeptidase
MENRYHLALARAERLFGKQPVNSRFTGIKAIIGVPNAPAWEKNAQAALDKLRNGLEPTPEELQALENVIRLMRPAPLVMNGKFTDLPSGTTSCVYLQSERDNWAKLSARLEAQIRSIGKISVGSKPQGTGFIVAKGVLATNRHVLDALTLGTRRYVPDSAHVNFKYEDGLNDSDSDIKTLRKLIGYSVRSDIAFFEVNEVDLGAVEFAERLPKEGGPVVTVGYPEEDSSNPLFMEEVFGGRYGFKRAAIGEVRDAYYPPEFTHDCSTLCGNSGSPVFCQNEAKVIGIHASGAFMFRNFAFDQTAINKALVEAKV